MCLAYALKQTNPALYLSIVLYVHCACLKKKPKTKQLTPVKQSEADESLDLNGIQETVLVGVKDVEDGSDEVLVVMETGVPGVGEGLLFDTEAGSYPYELVRAQLRQRVSQASHCNEPHEGRRSGSRV